MLKLKDKLRYWKNHLLIGLKCMFNKKINSRKDLPVVIKLLNLNGIGAEIGVALGDFSETILKKSSLSVLCSIDPWNEFSKYVYDDVNAVTQDEQEKRYRIVAERLGKYKNRSRIIRMTSETASELFEPETLDFIFIDANHSYEACQKDINLWWPKLKKGGVFAGHDYLDGKIPAGNFGVKRAVDEFAQKYSQKLFVTPEKWPTWYLVKGKHKLNGLLILFNMIKLLLK